ncbi:MAG: Obg family GTPase CgtA, partial [Oscillospiraceae bacterium]
FTTLHPNLGVVNVSEGESFVMADIPGLIEGASEGAGLGHDFLRHIDRCRLLVHIVDVSGSEGRDPIEDFETINAELKDYSPQLAERPQIVVGNKCDLMGGNRKPIEDFRAYVESKGYEFFEMSAVTHKGTRELVLAIAQKLKELPPIIIYEPEYVPPEPEIGTPDELTIENYDGVWIVEWDWIRRLLDRINLTDYESRMYFDRMLRDSGVFERLEAMGIKDGDTVSIYGTEFEYKA